MNKFDLCKVLRRWGSPMYHQIAEAIQVRRAAGQGAVILDNKAEYRRSILPELEVRLGGKIYSNRADNINKNNATGEQEINGEGGDDQVYEGG